MSLWTSTGRRRVGLSFVAAGAAATIALTGGPALADVVSMFELEGNVLDDASPTTPDWGASSGTNSIFSESGGIGVPRSPLPGTFFDAGFVRDFLAGSSSDTTAFTGGGSKDILDIPNWLCKTESNVTDKGDIQNAYSAVGTDPSNGHLMLYFGLEKNAPNGDNNMGVWFLQDGTVGCDGTGVGGAGKAFTGQHVNGDIFLVAAFTNGGATPNISAYQWNNGSLVPKGSGGKCGTAGSADLCAITNTSGSVTTPWQTTNKGSITPQNKTGQGTTLNAQQFYEGGVDLTANGLDQDAQGNPVCTNKFLFNTRSSQSTTASLYDFAEGNVHTCFPTSLTTLLKQDNAPAGPDANDVALPADGDHTVTLPVSVYDTSSLTAALADPTGTITYSLWRDSSCTVASTDPLFGTGTNVSAAVAVGSASPTLVFTRAGSYWWKASYAPSATSRNNASDSVCSTEPLVIEKPQPTIATTPNHTSIVIGGTPAASFNDVATVSNGYFPLNGIDPGTVTFKLYGPFGSAPGATSCIDSGTGANLIASASGDVAATRSSDTTATATSATYIPTAVGIYQWVAKYNGNDQNLATAFSACGDTTEQVTVQPATPSLATTMLLSDRVKVSGVANAGSIAGTVDFALYPNADCSGTTTSYAENGVALVSGVATTSASTLVTAGTYSWKVTFHPAAGSNYTGASTTCTAAQSDEKAVISYAGTSPIS